jgi:hypothetical protein
VINQISVNIFQVLINNDVNFIHLILGFREASLLPVFQMLCLFAASEVVLL